MNLFIICISFFLRPAGYLLFLMPDWPSDDAGCKSLLRSTVGPKATYLTYEQFSIASEYDGLAIMYALEKDTLWALYQKPKDSGPPYLIESHVSAWYARNRNVSPENELLTEKKWKEPCRKITFYRLWGISENGLMKVLWEAADREADVATCKKTMRTCDLIEESHSPQWLDLDKDGTPEWVDNIRLVYLEDPQRSLRQEAYAIQIWRWMGRELRLTGMDFSP